MRLDHETRDQQFSIRVDEQFRFLFKVVAALSRNYHWLRRGWCHFLGEHTHKTGLLIFVLLASRVSFDLHLRRLLRFLHVDVNHDLLVVPLLRVTWTAFPVDNQWVHTLRAPLLFKLGEDALDRQFPREVLFERHGERSGEHGLSDDVLHLDIKLLQFVLAGVELLSIVEGGDTFNQVETHLVGCPPLLLLGLVHASDHVLNWIKRNCTVH
jgi:hypothetical protein